MKFHGITLLLLHYLYTILRILLGKYILVKFSYSLLFLICEKIVNNLQDKMR